MWEKAGRAVLDAEQARLLGKPSPWLAVEIGRLRENAGSALEEIGPADGEAGLPERLPGRLDVEAGSPRDETGPTDGQAGLREPP